MKNIVKLDKYLEYVDDTTKQAIDAELSISEMDSEELCIKRIGCESSLVCGEDDELAISTGYASTRKLDHSGDIVVPAGINTSLYNRNPVVFFNHFKQNHPIGKAVRLEKDDWGLKIGIQYAVNENPEANTIYKLVKGRYLKQHSIGFIPTKAIKKGQRGFSAANQALMASYPEYKGDASRIILECLLLEVSVVNIADNSSAEILEVKGIDVEDIKALKSLGMEVKEVKDEKVVEEVKGIVEEVIEKQEDTQDASEDWSDCDIKKVEEIELSIMPALNIKMITPYGSLDDYDIKMAKLGKIVRY